MTDADYRPSFFDVSNLEEAMTIILTPEDGVSPQDRWQRETPPMGEMLATRLSPSSHQAVIDYGCGVGRLANTVEEIPAPLRHLTVEALDALRPLDIDTGPDAWGYQGYRVHTAMIFSCR